MSRNLDTYDGLLEQAVLALYLQWPFLPRRATLPALEQLRRNLAGELQSMAATLTRPAFSPPRAPSPPLRWRCPACGPSPAPT